MYSQNFSQVSLIRKKEPRFPRQLKHRRVFQQIYEFRILKPHTLSKRKWKNPKARNKIHTTIMWVKSDTTFFLLFWEVSILNLPNPSETSTLKRIPFVQSTIDECLPPLLSSRIFHYKKRKRKNVSWYDVYESKINQMIYTSPYIWVENSKSAPC